MRAYVSNSVSHCFNPLPAKENYQEALNDATAAVNLEPTLIKAIETGKMLDSIDYNIKKETIVLNLDKSVTWIDLQYT